ncbi:hypothetical protein IFM89_012512 [Coptis chinensis]|uniref:Uncharacterized protein n=1 Tax=Coptis chinensis TaxID=261450 RepID=A0A835I3Q5_9MAGN|nr:hypothetical protein IFM89_012512 [Coptis chinensis]
MVEFLQPKPPIAGGASIAQRKIPVVVDDNKENEEIYEAIVSCLEHDNKRNQQVPPLPLQQRCPADQIYKGLVPPIQQAQSGGYIDYFLINFEKGKKLAINVLQFGYDREESGIKILLDWKYFLLQYSTKGRNQFVDVKKAITPGYSYVGICLCNGQKEQGSEEGDDDNGSEVAILCITKSGEVLNYQAFTNAKGMYTVAETMPESGRWDVCLARPISSFHDQCTHHGDASIGVKFTYKLPSGYSHTIRPFLYRPSNVPMYCV